MFEDMRRKSSQVSRLRLSPNEEAQLVKEELDRRRKLRLQQVREQERNIAQRVRTQVRERRETHVQILADALQREWQQERTDKLQRLAATHEESLRSVGHAHRSARENESDLEAGARRSTERLERAADRHRQALRELTARRLEEEEQRRRHIEARKKALLEERKRALRVASLPPPPANPVESIGTKVCLPLKSAPAERFSVTHHHMPETAVDGETGTEQMDARQAAEEEVQRWEEVQRDEACARLEKLEKARLRGNHALKKEQDTQNRTRLLCELERLHQADLLRRRQAVNRIPAQIFQPLYRQEELRDEQQRDLEIAFHDMYTNECEVRGDLVLQLVPEPLPSAGRPNEDLDVTLDPDREEHYTVTETPESSGPSGDPDRRALRRLLDRIRDGRDRAHQRQSTAVEAEGDDVTDGSIIETGTLGSQEGEHAGGVTENEAVSEVSDEPVEAGMIPLTEHVMPLSAESEKRERVDHPTDEVALLRQQHEQLVLLEELEEKRRQLEWHLNEAQQERQRLEDASQVHSGIEEVRPLPEVTAGDTHTRRLHQYQQRLLEQNRHHKKCVEDARRRLEEYQHTLKLRHAIGISRAAQTLQPSSVCPPHPPNIRSSVHPSSVERDAIQTQSQQALISPTEPASFDVIINPSVLQSGVSVRWSEERSCEETSHDARVEEQPRVCVSDREQAPLPPPSVVLELLRSRQHRAAHTEVCDTSMSSFNAANEVHTSARTEKGAEPARKHDRWMSSADEFTLMNTLLKAIEESSSHAEPPCQMPSLPLPVSNEFADEQQVPIIRGKVKPPVSRPSARLAFLQHMEAHELSAIQEVDTPVNISLDAEVSESCSASLPAVVSDSSVSEKSQVTGRLSRMSWREALLIHSNTSASSINQQPEFGVNATPDRLSVDGECLSSTTVSTGSFSTSEHEPNCTITDSVGKENWVFQPSPKSASCQSPAMRDSAQQIIDKYTKDLDASLRTRSVHTGVNISSVSWSSVLQQDLSQDEDMSKGQSSAVDLSNAEVTGDFLPLQPHPDIDSSSSSSSSRDLVRNEQASRMQGWNKAVNGIIEPFSGQLWSDRGRMSGEPSSMSKDQLQASTFSQSQMTSVMSLLQKSMGPQSLPSEISHNSACPQEDESDTSSSVVDQTAIHGHSEGCESVLSQLIGRASDIDSSQVLDESNAPAGGSREMTLQQTVGGEETSLGSDVGLSEISSAALQCSEASHDDCFLSLPTEVTHNESLECSLPASIALVTDMSRTNISTCPPDTSASDCLEPTDASLSSFAFDTWLHQLRADTPIQSKSDLHVSMEQLSLTHDSLCETDTVAPPTASDASHMRSSPCAQDEKCDLASHSAVENTLDRLLDRVQELGDIKGILEESTISFVSLPESTLQDPDITGLEERTESVSEAKPGNEWLEEKEMQGETDLREGKLKGSSPSERPESSFSHKVVMLEFQSPSPRQQEALLRRRHHLAQRSALRAADVKAKRAGLKKMTGVCQNVSKSTLAPDCSVQQSETAVCRLKTVSPIKICTPEQRCLEEVEMYQRTHRLYSQLEEVKQKKELQGRQKAHAKNREKAKEFQRKTLEKLRAKQNG